MSAARKSDRQPLIRQGFPLGKVLLATAAYKGVEYFGPLYSQAYGVYVLDTAATGCAFIGIASALEVTEWSLNHLAERIEDILAKIPVGLKGAVHPFARWKEIKHLAPRWEDGPYWGVFERPFWCRNREIIKHVTSVAWVNGPSGSGKTTRLLQNSALTTRDSKYIVDFKGDLTHVLYKPLHERGEHIIVLDLAQAFADHPEIPSDSFNPLNMVSDCFFQKDGILDVRTMAVELVGQLYPDKDAGSHDPFWPNSARGVILLVMLYVILLHGEAGHLGHMEALIADGDALRKDMLWVCGKLVGNEEKITPPMPLEQSPWAVSGLHDPKDITLFIAWFRRRAKALAKMLSETDKKMAESFLTSAQVQLADYAMTGRAFKAIEKSTFRFEQLKGDTPTTIFMPMNPAEPKTQGKLSALMQWCMTTALKRHPDKHKVVYLYLDEFGSGAPVEGLVPLMTYARSYNLRMIMFSQNFASIKDTYSDYAISVLQSEATIKVFLPGSKEPETIEYLKRSLGEQNYVEASFNGDRDQFGVKGFSYQQTTKPVLSEREIEETDDTFLFVGQNKPIKVKTPSVAAMHPHRTIVSNNPHYGDKPYLEKIEHRMGSRHAPHIVRLWRRGKRVLQNLPRHIFHSIHGGQA